MYDEAINKKTVFFFAFMIIQIKKIKKQSINQSINQLTKNWYARNKR
jgi:hypothetical protein